jgi:DNA-binding XRE family transcriptional regulator
MPELTKKPITTDFTELCFRVPSSQADNVRGTVENILELIGIEYSISGESEALVSWEEVFPEYGAGDALKGARLMEGITQAQLADKIGIKRHHISEMENGKRPIGKEMARRLAKALNTGYKVFL